MKLRVINLKSDLDIYRTGAKWSIEFCSAWLTAHISKGIWWFRIFGYGIHWKNINIYPPLFSERYGYSKKLKIGFWYFGILKANT